MECPKCNYPNIAGVNNCSDCGYDLRKEAIFITPNPNKTEAAEVEHVQTNPSSLEDDQGENRTTLKNSKNDVTSNLRETISDKDIKNSPQAGAYNLQPVSLGEELTYSPLFFDDELIINRSNVDENDYSISSEKHAVISKSRGKFYIENCASNSAVFIKVKSGKKLKIEVGDIVLIGSKKFFEFQKQEKEEE